MVHGREGTERCPVYVGMRLGHFVCYCWKKKHVVVCKNHVNIYLLDVLAWKL